MPAVAIVSTMFLIAAPIVLVGATGIAAFVRHRSRRSKAAGSFAQDSVSRSLHDGLSTGRGPAAGQSRLAAPGFVE